MRPSRYSKNYLDKEEDFTLSQFAPEYKKALGYLGSHSGRNEDKIKATGLTPVFSDKSTYFAEADLVFICRRLYQAPLLETGYVDRELIDFNYPDRDFHEVYLGEIVKVLVAGTDRHDSGAAAFWTFWLNYGILKLKRTEFDTTRKNQ